MGLQTASLAAQCSLLARRDTIEDVIHVRRPRACVVASGCAVRFPAEISIIGTAAARRREQLQAARL